MRKSYVYTLLTVSFIGITPAASPVLSAESQIVETSIGHVKVTRVAGNIDTPWAMAMLPDGKLLVTEREGAMLIVTPGNFKKYTRIKGVSKVRANGQGGLLDVVLDPDYANNKTIYFIFSSRAPGGKTGTAIASATLDQKKARLENVKTLYSMAKTDRSGRHFGSRIVPDNKGHLYFTIGDRGTQPRAQDPFDAAGSVLRITTNGAVPKDNPFVANGKALPQIWSIGHRNPQGATLHPMTGKLWTQSHGAKGGDEINIPEAGKNYGWPVISYGRNYSGTKIGVGQAATGLEQPIYFWDPSIAPSGMDFYENGNIAAWNGDLFIGALRGEALVRLTVEGETITGEERLFEGKYGRIRDVRYMPDGNLWFLTNDGEGSIYRITMP